MQRGWKFSMVYYGDGCTLHFPSLKSNANFCPTSSLHTSYVLSSKGAVRRHAVGDPVGGFTTTARHTQYLIHPLPFNSVFTNVIQGAH